MGHSRLWSLSGDPFLSHCHHGSLFKAGSQEIWRWVSLLDGTGHRKLLNYLQSCFLSCLEFSQQIKDHTTCIGSPGAREPVSIVTSQTDFEKDSRKMENGIRQIANHSRERSDILLNSPPLISFPLKRRSSYPPQTSFQVFPWVYLHKQVKQVRKRQLKSGVGWAHASLGQTLIL